MDEGVMEFVGDGGLPTHAEWLDAVGAVLGDKDFDEVLVANLRGGLRIDPLYLRDSSMQEEGTSDYLPDGGSSRRASQVSGLLNGWDIRQRHWLTTPEETNRAILTDLERGANSIELLVGAVDQESLAETLQGVLMDVAVIAPIGIGDNVAVAKNFLACAEGGKIDRTELLADLSCDPIGQFVTQGTIRDDIDDSLIRVGDLAHYVAQEYGQVSTIRVDGSPYAHAGADHVTELAALTSTGIKYLQTMCDSGMEIEDAFRQILVVVTVGTDQFLDIAKIRAFREIWRRVGDACGVADVPLRLQASTSLSILSKVDPWVNLLRTTIGCFAAVIGGSDIVSVASFDSAIGLPNDFGMRLARNTHLVLMEEANIHRVIDPAGGSWYVESLTDQLAESAWESFQKIEKNGGILNELETGNLQNSIQTMRSETQRRVASNEQIIVGVNQFTSEEERVLQRKPYLEQRYDSNSQKIEPLPLYRLAEGFE
jgi:methylmalonyl-CoA mutase